MSSLLRPVILDPCQSSIRERRRSSIYPQNAVPRLTFANSSGVDDNAVADDADAPDTPDTLCSARAAQFSHPPRITPPSDAHVSDYFTSTAPPRHKNSAPPLYTLELSSPTSTVVAGNFSRSKTPSTSSEVGTSLSHRSMKWRLASGYFAYFLCGWGDGVTGTVLPFFTAEFHLTRMTSSLLFAGSTCGFALGTVLVERALRFLGGCNLGTSPNSRIRVPPQIARMFTARKGTSGYSASQARSLALAISSVLHALHFILIGVKGGFGLTFFAYGVAAFSRALLTACLNEYFASGPQAALGYSYGLWSFGGVVSPIICQSIVAGGVPWFHFYFGSLVLSGLNAAFLILSFKPYREEFSKERELSSGPPSPTKPGSSPSSPIAESLPLSNVQKVPAPTNMFLFALKMPYQWAFSIFAMLYCGSETLTQGFMATYLLAIRHADPNTAGYVTSGFWGGVTVGRFLWGFFAARLDFTRKKFIILGCMVLALAMHLLIWLVNSTVENAVSTSVIGMLYGPVFPACLSMANDILPSEIHMVSMTIISACASFGSALFPFIAGAIATVKGTQTLTYVTVPLGVILVCMWSMFPSRIPRS